MMPLSKTQVWQRLAIVEDWPRWWPGVEVARIQGPLKAGSQIDLLMRGRPETNPALLIRVVAQQELTWEREGVFGSRAGTRFVLEDAEGGCRVRVENYIRGPQAFLARMTGQEAFAQYQQKLLANLQQFLLPGGEKD